MSLLYHLLVSYSLVTRSPVLVGDSNVQFLSDHFDTFFRSYIIREGHWGYLSQAARRQRMNKGFPRTQRGFLSRATRRKRESKVFPRRGFLSRATRRKRMSKVFPKSLAVRCVVVVLVTRLMFFSYSRSSRSSRMCLVLVLVLLLCLWVSATAFDQPS